MPRAGDKAISMKEAKEEGARHIQATAKLKRGPFTRRRVTVGLLVLLALAAATYGITQALRPTPPHEVRGSAAWARVHYGNPDAERFKTRNIVELEFLGRDMLVHKRAVRHFLRLERLFEARAPEYAANVSVGIRDDWSYLNRNIRGGRTPSNHAFGLAIDINALSNVMGTEGDMPMEVVDQWEREGGGWGGRWSRSDPMHFETHLTPKEIRARYRPDGSPRDWYLEELTG